MELKDINFGIDHVYFCKRNSIHCYVVNSDSEDGASLIVEQLDNDDLDLTGNLFYSEACNLTEVQQRSNNDEIWYN